MRKDTGVWLCRKERSSPSEYTSLNVTQKAGNFLRFVREAGGQSHGLETLAKNDATTRVSAPRTTLVILGTTHHTYFANAARVREKRRTPALCENSEPRGSTVQSKRVYKRLISRSSRESRRRERRRGEQNGFVLYMASPVLTADPRSLVLRAAPLPTVSLSPGQTLGPMPSPSPAVSCPPGLRCSYVSGTWDGKMLSRPLPGLSAMNSSMHWSTYSVAVIVPASEPQIWKSQFLPCTTAGTLSRSETSTANYRGENTAVKLCMIHCKLYMASAILLQENTLLAFSVSAGDSDQAPILWRWIP